MQWTQNNTNNRSLRWLTHLLIVSGTLNIGLLATFLYIVLKGNPSESAVTNATKKSEEIAADYRGNLETLRLFQSLTFDQLVAKLNEKQLLEYGYTERDLALACLAAFHHFDLAGALPGQQLRFRRLSFGADNNAVVVSIFPGLSDAQYEAITRYLHTERWPLTSKGLFLKLQQPDALQDETLLSAFYLSQEFVTVESLFRDAGLPISREELRSVVLQGDWQMLSDFAEQQRLSRDMSPLRRQQFLLDYISRGSSAAAYLLLKSGAEVALKRLDEQQLVALINLLDQKTPEAETFCIDVLTSPRSDAAWQAAATRLYRFAGEEAPVPYDHMTALSRFVTQEHLDKKVSAQTAAAAPAVLTPAAAPAAKVAAPKKKAAVPKKETAAKKESKPTAKASPTKTSSPGKTRTHVVQSGDTLWVVAKKYGVSVSAIKAANQLTSDRIKPGTVLKIPTE